jgi:hypothetical protein
MSIQRARQTPVKRENFCSTPTKPNLQVGKPRWPIPMLCVGTPIAFRGFRDCSGPDITYTMDWSSGVVLCGTRRGARRAFGASWRRAHRATRHMNTT